MAVLYVCPHCRGELHSTRRLAVGGPVRCPKCAAVFAVPDGQEVTGMVAAPAVPAAERLSAAIAPPPRPPQLAIPRLAENRNRPARLNRSRWIALLVGGTVLLAAGIGTVLLIWSDEEGRNLGRGNENPVAYVPPSSAVIAGIDVAAVTDRTDLGAGIESILRTLASDGAFAENALKQTGLSFRDLFRRVVVAFKAAPINPRGPPSGPTRLEVSTLVIQSAAPFNQLRVRDAARDARLVNTGERFYFQIDDRPFNALFMPSDRIIVLTNVDAELPAIVGSSGIQPTLSREMLVLTSAAPSRMLWAAAPVNDAAKQQARQWLPPALGLLLGQVAPRWQALTDGLAQTTAAGLWMEPEGDALRVTLSGVYNDTATAELVARNLQAVWQEQTQGAAGLKTRALLEFLPANLKGLAREVVQSATFRPSASHVMATAVVSRSSLSGLVQVGQR